MKHEDLALEDMKSALEFNRRYLKGLPDDRWADGATGMRAVARGIGAMHFALSRMIEEREELSRASISLGKPKAV